jgi:hypothetical protein
MDMYYYHSEKQRNDSVLAWGCRAAHARNWDPYETMGHEATRLTREQLEPLRQREDQPVENETDPVEDETDKEPT